MRPYKSEWDGGGAGGFGAAGGDAQTPVEVGGGKRWLAPRLRELWRGHRDRRLVEPFCGGLAVALGLNPERAMLSDINPHPINFYQWLKHGLRMRIAMRNDAALFFYLNRTGYNGLCRFNRDGLFNVPFGRHARINYRRDFLPYRAAFAGWDFRTGDFASLPLEADDFIYTDPPYDVEFTQYSKERFAWADQVRLAEWLARHPGPVVLSNQATTRIVELYRSLGFALTILRVPRMISCTDDRKPARAVIAIKDV